MSLLRNITPQTPPEVEPQETLRPTPARKRVLVMVFLVRLVAKIAKAKQKYKRFKACNLTRNYTIMRTGDNEERFYGADTKDMHPWVFNRRLAWCGFRWSAALQAGLMNKVSTKFKYTVVLVNTNNKKQ